MRNTFFVFFTTLLASGLAVANAELPFQTVTVQTQQVARERVLNGSVDAVNQATVSSETSGLVESINYDVDDFVEEGKVILILKDVQQKAGLNQAMAAEAEARARLRQAQQEFDRIEDIYARQLVAKSQMDAAEAELKSAQARFNAAKASISKAQEQAQNTRVRAPYSGIVTQRHVELGEFVNVGQPLMTGVSLDKLRVNVEVPQRLINSVRTNQKARLILDQEGQTPVAVESLVFFPYANAASKTFKVRVNLAPGATGLFPGMFVKVAFATGETSQLVVPEKAIAYRSEVTAVYVIDEQNQPRFRHVRLGAKTGDGSISVLAGLDDGERVALDPVAAGIYLKQQQAGAIVHE